MYTPGEVRYIRLPYYSRAQNTMSFKYRPAVIIGTADSSDYIVLPISKVSNRNMLDITYDIPIDPATYPLLRLTNYSYIRAHKQTTVHDSSIDGLLGNLKSAYEELYLNVLIKREEFNNRLTNSAIE